MKIPRKQQEKLASLNSWERDTREGYFYVNKELNVFVNYFSGFIGDLGTKSKMKVPERSTIVYGGVNFDIDKDIFLKIRKKVDSQTNKTHKKFLKHLLKKIDDYNTKNQTR